MLCIEGSAKCGNLAPHSGRVTHSTPIPKAAICPLPSQHGTGRSAHRCDLKVCLESYRRVQADQTHFQFPLSNSR